MWTRKYTISCGSVSLVSIHCVKAVHISEKGTTLVCVSDLCSVKSSSAKTESSIHFSEQQISVNDDPIALY